MPLFNETAEAIRFGLNIGMDMVLLNAFAYAVEALLLLSSLILMTTYLVVSRLNRPFHSMLRILMNFMCFGMLINSIFRIFMVPVRLFSSREYHLTWVILADSICRTGQLIAILQIDCTAFLISIERLVATMFIERYENMFVSLTERITFTLLLIIGLYGSSYALFIARGDAYLETPMNTLMYIGYAMVVTNLTGFAFFRITQWHSQRYLTNSDHVLSKSYQSRENISAARLISPVCVLLFVTRFCQFAFRIYSYFVAFSLGAFLLRMLAHMYNISLAVSVFLTPVLLILRQPKLASVFSKRIVRKLNYQHYDSYKNTVMYFEGLQKMWT